MCKRIADKKGRTFFTKQDVIDSYNKGVKLEGKSFRISNMNITKTLFPNGRTSVKTTYTMLCDCGRTKSVNRLNTINLGISCCLEGCEYSGNNKRAEKAIIPETDTDGFFIKQSKWDEYKNNAKERNISFNISPSDVLDLWRRQGGLCNKTGRVLTVGPRKSVGSHTWSINRIDSGKSYSVDNIELVHKFCNKIQNKYSDKVLDTFCMARAMRIISTNPEYAREIKQILKDDFEDSSVLDDMWKQAGMMKNGSPNKGVVKCLIYEDETSDSCEELCNNYQTDIASSE